MCDSRKTWPETWMNVARALAESRSTDPRLKVAAILVPEDNTQIIAIGYNGDYAGGPNEPLSLEPGKSAFLHAELNCLIKADFNFPKKKRMYVTHSPCYACASALINFKVDAVIYGAMYRDPAGVELLRKVGISVMSLEEAVEAATSQRATYLNRQDAADRIRNPQSIQGRARETFHSVARRARSLFQG